MTESDDRLAGLALSLVGFLSPREKLVLVDMLGAGRVFSLGLEEMARLLGRRFKTKSWDPAGLLERARECEKILTLESIGCIFYWDRDYPPQLREIYDPPAALFFRGKLPDNANVLIGIVGTRLPTGSARSAAFALGFELGVYGIGVVSGLARGIDREAHEGCVAAGGYSVAVLGSGIDRIYPVSSRSAAMSILKTGGVIISEYPPGTPPLRQNFPARNRIISGLCRSVVVVQAPEKSGALITAEYALEQGRDLMVHRSGIQGSAGAGTRRLAEEGATLIEGRADILRDWGFVVQDDGSEPRGSVSTRETGAAIAGLVSDEISGSCARRGGQTLWRR